MADETSVGGIVGFLRLENRDFIAGINEAIRKTEILDGKRVDVEVDADTIGADAKLAATGAQLEKLDGQTARVGTSARRTRGHMGALATSIIGLGPALIPAAAGATALAVAFGGMGAAGIAAIVGIKQEMDDGTTTGLAYRDSIDEAKDGLSDLSRVAAGRMLRPFQDAVGDLTRRMPALTGQVGALASVTGLAAGALVGGLLNAFQALEPLMLDASVHVLRMSRAFESAMSGPGLVSFGEYLRSVLPQVLDALGSIAAAAAHLVQSLAPLGLGVLTGLQLLSDLLRMVPVDVLSVLAEGAWAVFLGFKSWQGLNAIIMGVNTALGKMNTTLALSAGAIRGLQIAAGVIGVALAGLSLIVSHNAEQQRQAEDAANRYADALRETNGVIDESIRQSTAKALADAGVLEAARQLGLNMPDVTDAALGNAAAMARVNAAIAANPDVWISATAAASGGAVMMGRLNDEADKVRGAILGENEALTAGIQKNKDIAAAAAENSAATSAVATETQRLATLYGTSAGTYQQVADSQQGIADKAAAATLQMQLENDAAGLLKQTLDLLNGESLSYEQALNGFQRQMNGVGQATRDAEGEIDKSKTALKGNSEAAVTNRSNLLGLATQAALVAEAFGNQKDSAEAGRRKLIELRDQILDNAEAQGLNRTEVKKFIDQVLKIPKKVPPTKADIDKAEAERKLKALQEHINSITGKKVTMTVVTQYFEEAARSERTGRGRLAANGLLTLASGVRAMADGDVVGRGPMLMRSMKPILWNEAPGGESYIPLHPSKRARSVDIWEQTGKALGVQPAAAQSGPIDLSRKSARMLAQELAKVHLGISTDQLDKALG